MIDKAIQGILISLFIFTPVAFGSMDIWAFSLMELGILLSHFPLRDPGRILSHSATIPRGEKEDPYWLPKVESSLCGSCHSSFSFSRSHSFPADSPSARGNEDSFSKSVRTSPTAIIDQFPPASSIGFSGSQSFVPPIILSPFSLSRPRLNSSSGLPLSDFFFFFSTEGF